MHPSTDKSCRAGSLASGRGGQVAAHGGGGGSSQATWDKEAHTLSLLYHGHGRLGECRPGTHKLCHGTHLARS